MNRISPPPNRNAEHRLGSLHAPFSNRPGRRSTPCRWLGLLPLAALLLLTGGCENVQPWQRGTLADYTMRADRDPLRNAQAEHIWFSREASYGGGGVGGGGCGCN